ncbi:MAG: hypothetical protein LBE92_20960 [Chryseobacterium sp.]|jgi:hypothetical protein|uniref:hypothetical protein n=1 Tax=Chryseobacterium sp. TaxID=1871047 RepID=UPI002824348E|nr:hypothetical protein [Chryseobacterium sp.]MDR2238608.1 hypothetical protein [Chryseobacterium sp.]
MKKYIILATLLSGLAVSGQRKPSSKAISPQSNTGAANLRVLDRAIKEYPFYFKGFEIEIHDDAKTKRISDS